MRRALLLVLITVIGCAASRANQPDPDAPLLREADYAPAQDPAPAEPALAPPPAAAQIAPGKAEIHRADLNRMLDAGPAALLAEVICEPARKDGRFLGFRINTFTRGRPRVIDLQPGDVVLSVNGRKIERPENFFEVFEALRKADMLRLKLLRGDQEIERDYPIVE